MRKLLPGSPPCILLTLLLFAGMTLPAWSANPRPRELRRRLEDACNAVELVVRNHATDLADLKHQQKDFEGLRVFARIPFYEERSELEAELRRSAQDHGLQLLSLAVRPRQATAGPGPTSVVFPDDPSLRLRPEQLAEALHYHLVVAPAQKSRVRAWVHSWKSELLRIVEPTTKKFPKLGPKGWELNVRAYRFRKVGFPRLKLRDPVTFLPTRDRKNLDDFARREPYLWSRIACFRERASDALPLYRTRQEFLLNSARMSFFLSKLRPSP